MSAVLPKLVATPDGVRITVRAKPRASRSRIVGVREGALEVALAAPPVDGAANEELVRTLADALDVPRRAITIANGARGKHKIVEIAGATLATVGAALARELVRNSPAP